MNAGCIMVNCELLLSHYWVEVQFIKGHCIVIRSFHIYHKLTWLSSYLSFSYFIFTFIIIWFFNAIHATITPPSHLLLWWRQLHRTPIKPHVIGSSTNHIISHLNPIKSKGVNFPMANHKESRSCVQSCAKSLWVTEELFLRVPIRTQMVTRSCLCGAVC